MKCLEDVRKEVWSPNAHLMELNTAFHDMAEGKAIGCVMQWSKSCLTKFRRKHTMLMVGVHRDGESLENLSRLSVEVWYDDYGPFLWRVWVLPCGWLLMAAHQGTRQECGWRWCAAWRGACGVRQRNLGVAAANRRQLSCCQVIIACLSLVRDVNVSNAQQCETKHIPFFPNNWDVGYL